MTKGEKDAFFAGVLLGMAMVATLDWVIGLALRG
jgi:hypothetical protein